MVGVASGSNIVGPTISVGTATSSNVLQGAVWDPLITGSIGTLIKTGAGVLVLTNTNNDFTATGGITSSTGTTLVSGIDIMQGTVSISSDISSGSASELGAFANEVLLNPSTGTSTLRYAPAGTGNSLTMNRQIQFTTTANTRAIEVTIGNTLTLTSPFDLVGGAQATATLTKNDNGTLVLAASNASWTGNTTAGLIVTMGVVELAAANAAGASTNAIEINNATGTGGADCQWHHGVKSDRHQCDRQCLRFGHQQWRRPGERGE